MPYVDHEKHVIIYNCTSHALDFVEHDGAPLKKKRIDFTVPVDDTINAKFVDSVKQDGPVAVYCRDAVLEDAELMRLKAIINDGHDTAKKLGWTDYRILIYVSLPTAIAISGLTAEKTYIGSIITATDRSIKPPVAKAYAISIQ